MDQGEASAVLGRPLAAETWAALVRFLDLLEEANVRFNITAVRDRDGMYRRHILESLALAKMLERHELLVAGSRVIDVGSGGGIPGIPLAIVRPDVEIVLLEATAKKAGFLADTVTALRLDNASSLAARAEEAGQQAAYRETAALVTARAVAALATLAELTLPLTRLGGVVAAVKGSQVDEELQAGLPAIARCGGVVEAVLPLDVARGASPRVVLWRKQSPTPSPYPRRSGMPAKRPLR